MARTAQLDLFDLSGIRTEQRVEEIAEGGEVEEEVSSDQHLDPLPPSYSLAEGLDQLPDYKEAEVFQHNFVKMFSSGQMRILCSKSVHHYHQLYLSGEQS